MRSGALPSQLTDIEQQGAAAGFADQRAAAFQHQPGFLARADDFQFEPGFGIGAGDEPRPVFSLTAGFGGDRAQAGGGLATDIPAACAVRAYF
jgi:hypothetical protein